MFRRKTTIEILQHGADSKTTHHWWGKTEEGSRTVVRISTNNPDRDLPKIAQMIESKLPQESHALPPVVGWTIDTKALPSEPKLQSTPKQKKGWFS
jgi:hypothetical protein